MAAALGARAEVVLVHTSVGVDAYQAVDDHLEHAVRHLTASRARAG